jgi:hypothetical protein
MEPYSPEDVTYVEDRSQSPQPDADARWWRIRLPDGRKGWAFAGASAPQPDEAWVANELNRLASIMGDALETRLTSSNGTEIHPTTA